MANKGSYKEAKLQGVCMLMCPTQESILRMREKLYHPLECKVDATGKRSNFPDTRRFVKEYSRPAADQTISPFTVRPLPVLKKTVNYLLSHITNCEDLSWREIYEFISDRLRAVHKDVLVQDLFIGDTLDVLAPMARFYLYAHYRLCECNPLEFDPFLNLKQLNQTLLNITYIFKKENYQVDRTVGSNGQSIKNSCSYATPPEIVFSPLHKEENFDESPTSKLQSKANDTFDDICDQLEYLTIDSESDDKSSFEMDAAEQNGATSLEISDYSLIEEMMSLNLLVNLGNEEVINEVLELPPHVRRGPLLRKVLDSCIWWLMGNYVPLLRLATTLPPIFCCAIHLHLNKLQRHALGVLSVAHSSPNIKYDLKDLEKGLLSSNYVLREACVQYGLSVSDDAVQFKKGNFNWEASMMKPTKAEWLDEKLSTISIEQILLPPISS